MKKKEEMVLAIKELQMRKSELKRKQVETFILVEERHVLILRN
jgi:hypothetical protein